MKRFLSLFLSVLLLVTLLPSSAMAVETFYASEEGIAFIKEFEGFRPEPYEDRGKWYIGYGTLCEPADFPVPITEMEADWLLREALADKEERVNKFLVDYGISINQFQFDALVSMTYNLGHQWINTEYRLCSYLINGIYGYSELEVINAIGTWCHQGETVLTNLVTRRLREAFLFMYGLYDYPVDELYTYIHFDPAGGEVENKTVFYPIGYTYGQLPVPQWGGRPFLGWYTEDGQLFTGMETVEKPVYLTAVWDGESEGEWEEPKEPEIDLSTWVNPYSDVKETDWYYGYVRELSAKGVVGGYPDGTFQGKKTLTAGEALKLVLLAVGYPEQERVAGGHWASGYLALAQTLGCVGPGEISDLNGAISRLTIARVAAIAMGLQERYGTSPFADTASGYALTLYEEGIFQGSIIGRNRFFYPDDGIVRSEVCAIVSRINNWEYVEAVDPGRVGYVTYRNKNYPLERNMPVCPYNKNLFVLSGSRMYYNDPAYTPALGIDVSSYQGDIDWQQVAATDIEFVMIRLGYRGYSEGTLNLDAKFLENLEGAKAAGLKVGVYFFSQAITTTEAMEEAMFVLQNLGGVELDYPVVFDWETISGSDARTDYLETDVLTDCAVTFCEMIAQAGYVPMIYYNSYVGYAKFDLDRLAQYDVWYAQYAQKPTMYYNYRIWQYTDSGEVPGIDTRVDMNLAFLPYY